MLGSLPSSRFAASGLYTLCADQAFCSWSGLNQHLVEIVTAKITIPAVKITGDTAEAVFQDEDLAPYPCSSEESMAMDADELLHQVLDPIDSSLFTVKEEEVAILSGSEEENDFGEFLLDAVDWL